MRADLYSLGCTLFQCATGQLPIYSDDMDSFLQLRLTQSIPDPKSIQSSLSSGISLLIQKLIKKDVDERYHNADQVLFDLNRMDMLNYQLSQGKNVSLGVKSHLPILSKLSPMVGRNNVLNDLLDHTQRALKAHL